MSIHVPCRYVLATLVACLFGTAQAGVYTVTTPADGGAGSLRQILADLPADEANEIRFQPGGTGIVSLQVATDLPPLRGTGVLIDGSYSMGGIEIDGTDAARLITAGTVPTTIRNITLRRGRGTAGSGCVTASASLTLENVTIAQCRTGFGSSNAYGGGVSSNGALTVRRSVFRDNLSQSGAGGGDQSGGAIYHNGTLVIEDSLFEDNEVALGPNSFSSGGAVTAIFGDVSILRSRFIGNTVTGAPNGGAAGGGLRCGRAICSVESSYFGANASSGGGAAIQVDSGALSLRNVTVHGNMSGYAGAVRVVGSPGNPASLSIDNSTFSLNEIALSNGAGVHLDMFLDTSVERIANTVFGPRAGAANPLCHRWDSGPHYDGPGFNRAVDASCDVLLGSDSAVVAPETLGLGVPIFGGAVEVLDMSAGSVLVDAGNPAGPGSSAGACAAVDANDVPRPQDGNGDGSLRCDIGASELRGMFRGDIDLNDPPPARTSSFTLSDDSGTLGSAVANVGDVNGDGIDDMGMIGPNQIAVSHPGMAWIVYGRAAGFPASLPVFGIDAFFGFEIRAEAGRPLQQIARGGDFNGDGFGDVLLGAPAQAGHSNAGAAYIVYGGAALTSLVLGAPDGMRDSRIEHAAALPNLGSCIDGLGDFDGDGVDDLLIGAASTGLAGDAGRAFVLYGRQGISPQPVSFDLGDTVVGNVLALVTSAPDRIGDRCAAAGDVDGDGLHDAFVGAPARQSTEAVGGAYLLYGRGPGELALDTITASEGRNFVGLEASDGYFLSGGIDFDGDGRSDPLIGTRDFDVAQDTRNLAFLVSGGAGAPSPVTLGSALPDLISVLQGDGPSRTLFPPLAMDDHDGDARPDLAAGAPLAPGGGRVLVNLSAAHGAGQWPPLALDVDAAARGRDGYRVLARTGTGRTAALGSSLAHGDFNHDGLDDLLIGAPGENRVWLVLATPQADMAPDFSQLPRTGAPGTSIGGTVSCGNTGTRNALRATCLVETSVASTITCVPAAPVTLAPGQAIDCAIGFVLSTEPVRVDVGAFSATQDPDVTNNRGFVLVGGPDRFAAGFRDGFEN